MLAEPNSLGLIGTLADVTIDRSGESDVITYQGPTTGFPRFSLRRLLKCDLGTSPIVGLEISALNASDGGRCVGPLRREVSMSTEQGQSPDDARICPE